MPGRSRQVSLSALAARSAAPDVTQDTPSTIEDAMPAPDAPSEPVADRLATVAEAVPAAAHSSSPSPRRASHRRTTQPAPGEWVRFDQYERKEARLRPDQYGRLSTTSRELNRARRGTGERITENTLIRVAIDLLLERGDQLTGTSEAELRKSVGL
jgi:hypothetical protein